MSSTIPGRKEIHSELVKMLNVHLANIFTLKLKFQNFHWNAEGPGFYSVHAMFEEFYRSLEEEIDVTAERIRMLGEYAPATLREFHELARIADRQRPLDIDGMLEELITCCVIVREFGHENLKISGLVVDEVTSDILIRQISMLEKAIWMLRSTLSRSRRKSLTGEKAVTYETDSSENLNGNQSANNMM